MAILDNALSMASAVAVTDTAKQIGDVIDLKKDGDGIPNNPLWRIKVEEAVASGTGGSTVTFDLETSIDEAFTAPIKLVSSGAIVKTILTLNSIPVELPIPKTGLKQYLRTWVSMSATLTAGKFDSFIGY
jgi:hypothetical protein